MANLTNYPRYYDEPGNLVAKHLYRAFSRKSSHLGKSACFKIHFDFLQWLEVTLDTFQLSFQATVVSTFSIPHPFLFSVSHWGRHWWNSCFSTAAVLPFKLKPGLALCYYCLNIGWFGNKLYKTLPGCCTRSGPAIPKIGPNSKETFNLLMCDNSCPTEEER